jgi:carboxypeptidase C (cathepsin A)
VNPRAKSDRTRKPIPTGAVLLLWIVLGVVLAAMQAAFPAGAANTVMSPAASPAATDAEDNSRKVGSGKDKGSKDESAEDADLENVDEDRQRSDRSAEAPEPLSTTRHRLEVQGESLPYTATAGRLSVGIDGAPKANIFFVSYERSDDGLLAKERPVTFVFNGGPGAASAYLHLGALGPRRLVLDDDGAIPRAPARLAVNQETWLTFTDLVFVDPVGTGYSQRAGAAGETRSAFWETRTDLRSLAEFIRLYLTRNNRHLSPVFLVGESYGGFRAAALAGTLTTDVGVGLNGIVLVSPVLEFSLMYGDAYTLLPWALLLPAYAATALAHDRADFADTTEELGRTLEAVEAFSLNSYLTGMAEGDGLNRKARAALYKQIARFTGLSEDVVARYRGRIPRQVFAKELLAGEARFVSLYDGSIEGIDPSPESAGSVGHDPVLQGLTAPLTSALVAYVRDDLGYESDRRYQLLNRNVSQAWQWQQDDQGYLGAADDLKAAMSLNRHLQALIVHGYYDLVTSYFASRYVVDQMALDAAIRPNLTLATYNGGHMFYTRTQARRRLTEDARAFYHEATVAPAEETDTFEPARVFKHKKSAAERDLLGFAPAAGASVKHLSRDDP